MANYAKQTWVDGNVANPVSAARMGVIEQGVFDAHFQPAARAHKAADQTITTATWTLLTWDTEDFDTDTIHDNVTNADRLTCKTAGKYLVVLNANFASNATGFRVVAIQKNSEALPFATPETQIGGNAVSGTTTGVSCSAMVDMAVNDYVASVCFQSSGGNLAVTAVLSNFAMTRVA